MRSIEEIEEEIQSHMQAMRRLQENRFDTIKLYAFVEVLYVLWLLSLPLWASSSAVYALALACFFAHTWLLTREILRWRAAERWLSEQKLK